MFTSKKEDNKFIFKKWDLWKNLFENVFYFYLFVKYLYDNTKDITENQEGYFYLYRTTRMDELLNLNIEDTFLEPIPFSCSWNKNFPIDEWLFPDKCCVLRLKVPIKYPFISNSYPTDKYSNDEGFSQEFFWSNQNQYEVVLPPSEITIKDKTIEHYFSKKNESTYDYDINIIDAELTLIPCENLLRKLKDTNWIDEGTGEVLIGDFDTFVRSEKYECPRFN